MWGSEKFVHLSTKQKNQWFKLRLWSKTVYLRMEGEDDESEDLGSTIQSKGQWTGEMKKRVQAGWTGWRDAAETHHDGTEKEQVAELEMLGQNRIINIRGKVHTEDNAAEPEEDHRKRFKDAAKEAAGCWRCSRNKMIWSKLAISHTYFKFLWTFSFACWYKPLIVVFLN